MPSLFLAELALRWPHLYQAVAPCNFLYRDFPVTTRCIPAMIFVLKHITTSALVGIQYILWYSVRLSNLLRGCCRCLQTVLLDDAREFNVVQTCAFRSVYSFGPRMVLIGCTVTIPLCGLDRLLRRAFPSPDTVSSLALLGSTCRLSCSRKWDASCCGCHFHCIHNRFSCATSPAPTQLGNYQNLYLTFSITGFSGVGSIQLIGSPSAWLWSDSFIQNHLNLFCNLYC